MRFLYCEPYHFIFQVVLMFGLLTRPVGIKLPFVLQRGTDSKIGQITHEGDVKNTAKVLCSKEFAQTHFKQVSKEI